MIPHQKLITDVSSRALGCGNFTSASKQQWIYLLSKDRTAPIFPTRCMAVMQMAFSIPYISLADKTTSHSCQNQHLCTHPYSLLMWGRFWRAHLLCFIISPMEKQTSLCFSSERCFTSGPTSSFRRSMCSRVCWTKYPTAPCWDGSKAWICCKMSRTFSNRTKKKDSEQVSRAAQHLHIYIYTDILLNLAGSKCPGLEIHHTSFPHRTKNLCSRNTLPSSSLYSLSLACRNCTVLSFSNCKAPYFQGRALLSTITP